ncbi:DUF6048 family protein [Cellulophaga sp. F20128]|uniref:DUF6048 family protein n=1 Tax=Cellulophaga sp. F20128 TaxID=2926413 RepID=UPI001FF0F3B0|nr:DUF6048 family protein [Cellulophaga sp. F20128]MCK0157577.1 DUF6048 family protein [Cellulophaga sp. F20128]
MLKYTISIFFLFASVLALAQSKTIDLNKKDSVAYQEPYGIRVGVDISRLAKNFYSSDYSGFEITGDYRITHNLYLAAELGNENNTRQEDYFNFTTSGSYLKIGADINMYENWYGMNNTIFIGGRYGYSSFNHTINNYQIYDADRYWSPDDFVEGATNLKEFSGLNASWLEFVLGTKVELFKNLYLGASVRLGFLVSNKRDAEFANIWIPGFNKTTEGSKFGTGYNYSLSYLIPLYKKAKKKKKEVEKKKAVN